MELRSAQDPTQALDPANLNICVVGASGKLGRYMVRHALDRGYRVTAVCREGSMGKLDALRDRIAVIPGATDDRDVIARAVAGCDGVLTVLVPRGVNHYSAGTDRHRRKLRPPEPDTPVADFPGVQDDRSLSELHGTRRWTGRRSARSATSWPAEAGVG